MSSRPKVLVYEPVGAAGMRLLEEKCEVICGESLEEERLIAQVKGVEGILIRANGTVSRRIIEAAPRLKVIGRHGVGIDNIDLAAAREHGVTVVFTPTANAHSVSEHFVGLALMLMRKLRVADRELRAGNWPARHELIGTELFGKTLGVLGFGRIGKQTARACHNGFGMHIIYHDVLNFPETEKELEARRLPIEQVFAEADFISINLPLSPETKGLININLLKRMKPTAYVFNMARGALWKEADVVRALQEKWIAGAGSDVFEVEPASPENPLFQFDNFVGTPHMASHTQESLTKMSFVTRDIIRVIEGQEPEFPVPESFCGR